ICALIENAEAASIRVKSLVFFIFFSYNYQIYSPSLVFFTIVVNLKELYWQETVAPSGNFQSFLPIFFFI
ncbi:MAG: hypothetical protein ACK514_10625, partial [Bacteroidota bacterium]